MTGRIAATAAVVAAGIVLGAVTPSTAGAQAWTREAGTGYFNLSYRYLRADEFYGPDGGRVDILPFAQHVIGLYGSVGVVDRWLTLIVDGELLRRNVLIDQGATTGMGDFQLSAWTGALTEPLHLSFGVGLGLPLGDPSPEPDDANDPAQRLIARSLPTGDGEWDVTFQAAAGHGFGARRIPLRMYAQGVLGYALRTEGFTDQVVYRAEMGFRIDRDGWRRALLILRVHGRALLGDAAAIQGTVGVGDGVSYLAYGPELIVDLWRRLAVSASVESAAYATNVPSALAYKLAVSWELERRDPEPQRTPGRPGE